MLEAAHPEFQQPIGTIESKNARLRGVLGRRHRSIKGTAAEEHEIIAGLMRAVFVFADAGRGFGRCETVDEPKAITAKHQAVSSQVGVATVSQP